MLWRPGPLVRATTAEPTKISTTDSAPLSAAVERHRDPSPTVRIVDASCGSTPHGSRRPGGGFALAVDSSARASQTRGVRDLPRGTVTFLFTDIDGSTRLLHELGDQYADVLAEHRRLLREAFGRHGGAEVDTQGDAFFYAFARATDAVAAADTGQRALEATRVRVRMGIHTGEPAVTDEGYVGMDVHRAARVMSTGHGGQVVISETTA